MIGSFRSAVALVLVSSTVITILHAQGQDKGGPPREDRAYLKSENRLGAVFADVSAIPPDLKHCIILASDRGLKDDYLKGFIDGCYALVTEQHLHLKDEK